ncbi:amino acid transporter [Luteitalea sp. TBR-22]|uniref:APC family permease n=1 Tax=Luteitalea sp. TBR-22 TaxID=2802971 RepID=UPI001EF40BBA|nr:APC family permease [Luteitalea sp. TBR-22]BCS35356.2 amino acid transporter [Luteitalea sp. TBR-22]
MRPVTTLARTITVRGLTASLFNMTVGGGIFAMPALVAQMLGASAVHAYFACALAMLCILLAYAVAGSRVPRAGGVAAYADAAFGPLVGFLGGALNWLSDTLAGAAVLAGLTAAIAVVAPALASRGAQALVLAAILGTLAWVNVRSVRHGTHVVEMMTVAKLLPLLALVGAAAWVGGTGMWRLGPLPEPTAIGRATLVLIFAFSGSESVMGLCGEVRRPTRTIPIALLLGLALVTSLYVAVHLAARVGLGEALPTTPDATLAAAAGALMGPRGRWLLLVGTVVSMAGFASAAVMSTPRILYAVAQRGLLPAWLARVHPQFRTPHPAIVAQAIALFVVASSGTFDALAGFASVAVVSGYLLACVTAITLQWRGVRVVDAGEEVDSESRPLHVPTVVLAIGAAFCVALLAQATRAELLVEVGLLAAATAWYAVRARARRVSTPAS